MKNKRSWLAAPYVVWMALFTVIPIVMMVVYAFTQDAMSGGLLSFQPLPS